MWPALRRLYLPEEEWTSKNSAELFANTKTLAVLYFYLIFKCEKLFWALRSEFYHGRAG